MLTGTAANSIVFSIIELDPSPTPMWAFGHSNLRDRWIPVALPPPVDPRSTFSAGLRARITDSSIPEDAGASGFGSV